jgi:aromatic-L-amino-acid decarboxylase
MDNESFRRSAHRLVDWIAHYLDGGADAYPVLSRVRPGEIAASLPSTAPAEGRPMPEILDDFERLLLPGLTHWNHPGFMAYFNSSASGPGVLAELLTAAINQQAMLWRTSPAATELEAVALGWLRDLLGLPPAFAGVIFDGGSSSNLHALLAARQAAVSEVRTRGLIARADLPPVRVYCSEHAHSSVDKAAMVLGLGQGSLRKIPADDRHRMRADALAEAIRDDEAAGVLPIAVVATVGTTSSGSIDPVPAVADLCAAHRIWLHVDASWAGPAAMLPEEAAIFDGVARADSVVVNPHKWLFTPLDLSAFYCRRMDVLEAALALTPDYLATSEAGAVRNLMDTGVALGRRFRALKLWMMMSFFGADGLRARLREHIRLAHAFAAELSSDPDFELLEPVSLALVCFRAVPSGCPAGMPTSELDDLNAALLEQVNASGEVYLSHTRLDGRYTLRLVVGHLRTSEQHVARAHELLRSGLDQLLGPRPRAAS